MKKTIFLSGALLLSSTLFFAKSKENMDSFQNLEKYATFDFGKGNPKQHASVKFAISPVFNNLAIIGYGDILKMLPTVSDNEIYGSWVSSTITPAGSKMFYYKCIFIPTPGQNATSATKVFTVFADYIIRANNGSGGGNIYNLISINGQFGFTSDMVSYSIDFPENAGIPVTIDNLGNITLSGQNVKYKAWINGCDANYSIGYIYPSYGGGGTTARMTQKTEINADLTIYPNPSKDIFNIDLRGTEEQYDLIKVFRVTGALIHEGQLKPRSVNTIDLSSAKTGYYFAQISNNNSSKTLTLIKE